MYSSCLFCAASLGANDVIEHFPVGRRLAYDAATGRLWVVCKECERWNLTPLEQRWEAIEEAERLFRATRFRVATDNIALAKLREGTELVRIGAPPKIEFAAWRYGDQFGRRRKRHLVVWGGGTAFAFGALALQGASILIAPTVVGFAMAPQIIVHIARAIQRRRDERPRFAIHDPDNGAVAVTPRNARITTLAPGVGEAWSLKVPVGKFKLWRPGPAIRPGVPEGYARVVTLSGDAALNALAAMLPYLNRDGASTQRVREAVDLIDASPDLAHLVRIAAVNDDARRTHFKLPRGESNVGVLPARIRFALEMALHDADEQRAMNGELRALEERWREADEIARIADSLTLPADIDQRIQRLRGR